MKKSLCNDNCSLVIKDKINFVRMIYGVLTATEEHLIPSFVHFSFHCFAGVAMLSLKG